MHSILFVPADRPKLFEKAASSNASVICIDLEDGVVSEAKPEARSNVKDAVDLLIQAGKSVAMRINSDLEEISFDLATITRGMDTIVVPKSGSARMLMDISDAARRISSRSINLLPLVESAADLYGLEQAGSLPDAVIGLCLGTEDLAVDLGVSSFSEPIEASFLRLAIVAARHRISLFGYPGSIAEYSNIDKFRSWVQAGKDCGSIGGFAIHPAQIDILNSCFELSEDEKTKARNVVQQFEKAITEGKGVISLDGRMVDRPVYLAAKRKLA